MHSVPEDHQGMRRCTLVNPPHAFPVNLMLFLTTLRIFAIGRARRSVAIAAVSPVQYIIRDQ